MSCLQQVREILEDEPCDCGKNGHDSSNLDHDWARCGVCNQRPCLRCRLAWKLDAFFE